MNVLSLFDGIACGKVALDRAGIKYDNYFASEIDKWAMQIAKKNHPDIIHLGDVKDISAEDLPEIDLLIGGSPCQGFSFAGQHLNFDDPRSSLFFEFVRLLNETKPKYFLLENVVMAKKHMDVITGILGVPPLCIDSARVSAQSRRRLYWTNIPNISQPDDMGIMLNDILESGISDRTKSYTINATYYNGVGLKEYFENHRRQIVFEGDWFSEKDKSYPIDRNYYKGGEKTGIDNYINKSRRQLVFKYNRRDGIKVAAGHIDKSIPVLHSDWRGLNRNQDQNAVVDIENLTFRRLTPIECERLQTLPDNYTAGVSNTQRYKALGNGWTVDVIVHILKNMENIL